MIELVKGPLKFTVGPPIVHCISADRACGAGFAAQVPVIHLAQIREQRERKIGEFHVSMHDELTIVHLVTKKQCYYKPTLTDFKKTVEVFSQYAKAKRWERVRCPRLGCGLDKLKWSDVSSLLEAMPITYEVYYV